MKEAWLYKKNKKGVECELCPHGCSISDGRRGLCGVRENRQGILYSHVYGELVAHNIDPIEKKPLFHVLPGSSSLSISTVGCNFRCLHCQNSSISQAAGMTIAEMSGRKCGPDFVVAEALHNRCKSISYTYVEPTVFYEFAYDCCEMAKERGIHNVFVSNGYISEKALRKIAPFITAINIDIKSFSEEFYLKICGAKLQPVLETVRLCRELGIWVEITSLLIPGLNDTDNEIKKIASFIRGVDPCIPWHVSAFHPMYKMQDRPPTPRSCLEKARIIGIEEGLKYVYEGNAPGAGGENTFCYSCGETVISRYGFRVRENHLQGGRCQKCQSTIDGIWS